MIVTSWSQDGCDIRAPKRQEDEERAVPPHLLPFIRKTKSLPETPNRLPFKCSWLELCYVPPPTQHQLQGRLGMGVFSWAHCHIKQNQDYASKEEGNWSILGRQQTVPAKDRRRALATLIQFNQYSLGTYEVPDTVPCALTSGFCLRLSRIQRMKLLHRGELLKWTSSYVSSFILFLATKLRRALRMSFHLIFQILWGRHSNIG